MFWVLNRRLMNGVFVDCFFVKFGNKGKKRCIDVLRIR